MHCGPPVYSHPHKRPTSYAATILKNKVCSTAFNLLLTSGNLSYAARFIIPQGWSWMHQKGDYCMCVLQLDSKGSKLYFSSTLGEPSNSQDLNPKGRLVSDGLRYLHSWGPVLLREVYQEPPSRTPQGYLREVYNREASIIL